MPSATTQADPGLQALILCGPGVSLTTFTANPEEFPKALLPIANRPMIWYPINWCLRMGITRIHLITPPSSAQPIAAALAQNPYLTSLPAPRAEILAPESLTHTTGTAEIIRLPEVQHIITTDFLIVPCDLICELPGESLLDSWLLNSRTGHDRSRGEILSAKGGLGVWYNTREDDNGRKCETDFLITTALQRQLPRPPRDSLQPHLSRVLCAMPTDSLKDRLEKKKGLPIRKGMIARHGKIDIYTTHRDAHVYVFPYWIKHFVRQNENFDSISEDLVGWWVKAGWQDGLGEKLGLSASIQHETATYHNKISGSKSDTNHESFEDIAKLQAMSSTSAAIYPKSSDEERREPVPAMVAYIHPENASRIIRRVDNASLLLNTSIRIAAMPSLSDIRDSPGSKHDGSSPLLHAEKISTSLSLIAPHTTIHADTTLIGAGTSIATHCTIKSSCIGSNCSIERGAKLTDCVIMDSVHVKPSVRLTGCIVGRRCVVGQGADLTGCEVQDGYHILAETVGKAGEKFSVFEGLENGLEEMSIDDKDEEEMEGTLATPGNA